MNGFYKIRYFVDLNIGEDVGVVVADDEAEMVRKLKDYYGDIDEVTLRFGENYESDVVSMEDFNSLEFNI